MNAIDSLIHSFSQEARNAPKLFGDLAKVEQYIAESYKARALIELLQNADDAQSKKFGIHDFADGLAVGNDGQPFTLDDIEALCRSGASDKRRGASTIGYRGIGFKSVVNLAESVYVFSGEHAFFFDKDATRSMLGSDSDVPLIRIPHTTPNEPLESIREETRRLQERLSYNTVFVFRGLNKRLLAEEIAAFDRGCLLFLHNIRSVTFDFHEIQRNISVQHSASEQHNSLLAIRENDQSDEWKIYSSPRDKNNTIAFKTSQGIIVPAQREESVFHSFTPTTQFTGAFLKINGDYSTDPSRKNLDMDEHSLASLADSVTVLCDTVTDILSDNAHHPGFFTAFSSTTQGAFDKSGPQLLSSLRAQLGKSTFTDENNQAVAFSALRLRPDWLSYDDYEKVCIGEIVSVRKSLLGQYPELVSFLSQMNVPTLSLQEVLNRTNQCKLTRLGGAQVFTKVVKQFRYDLDPKKVEEIKSLKIFPVGEAVVSACDVQSTSDIDNGFLQFVFDNNDTPDLKLFWNKFGIPVSKKTEDVFSANKNIPQQSPAAKQEQTVPLQKGFRFQPNLTKWRSAEKNTEEYLKALNGVLEVLDISKANLGYDLEVTLENNKRFYVEVKSVSAFTEPFRLTNNEYSSAHQHGDDYLVAVVINGSPFQIKIISNPIVKVELHKQCERWSWYCDTYEYQLDEISNII